jgi:CheY-like chemotaxis protein
MSSNPVERLFKAKEKCAVMDADSKTESNENKIPNLQSALDLEHDLRNLSAAMQCAVDVIRLDSGLSADSSEMLTILDRQLDRLVQLASVFSGRLTGRISPGVLSNSTTTKEPPSGPICSAVPARRRHDILVVDDSRIVAYTLQVMLQKLGQNVRIASDGFSAIASMVETFPDIVISDVAMNGVNGYELAESIRSMPRGQTVRLIAMTGSEGNEVRQKSLESGFDEHFVKPVAYRDLLDILDRVPRTAELDKPSDTKAEIIAP